MFRFIVNFGLLFIIAAMIMFLPASMMLTEMVTLTVFLGILGKAVFVALIGAAALQMLFD